MSVVILATNGGPHPPDKWAALSASQISNLVQIDEQSSSDDAAAARKAKPRFSIAISDALEPVFSQVMEAERDGVESGAIAARNSPFNVGSHLDEAVSAVVGVSGIFSSHFTKPDVQSTVRVMLTQNFLDAANIQRSWAFDAKGL